MRFAVLLFVSLGISLATTTTAHAQRVNDERVWLGAGVDAGLGPTIRVGAEQQLRLGVDAGFVQTHTQLNASVRVVEPLRLGVLYRFIINDVETRHRLGFEGRLQGQFGDVTLGLRSRLQLTTRPNNNADQVLVRNRGAVAVEVTKRVEPYASIELHHQVSPNAEYREVRFELGVGWKLTKKWGLDFSYLYQSEANIQVPETNHVLAAGVTYHFGNLRKGDAAVAGKD